MTRQRTAALGFFLVLLTLVLAPPATSQTPQASQTPKSGGVLNMMLREDLAQGFAIHETATISTVWPAMPCFNNLVLFDPLKKTESVALSSASWPRSGRGRTTSGISCSSSARA